MKAKVCGIKTILTDGRRSAGGGCGKAKVCGIETISADAKEV